jgi:hypothetical protein
MYNSSDLFSRRGTYRPTTEKYSILEALAAAVAVDRAQGFVKSGQGYYDPDRKVHIEDNRVMVLRTLRNLAGRPDVNHEGVPHATVEVTDADREKAQEIFDYFDQICLMDKMGDNLVKSAKDGTVNDYNLILSEMFDRGEADINKELAMVASLPNSRRMAEKRDEMDRFYEAHRDRGYIGDARQRIKITGEVKDVKYLPKYNIHLAVMLTDGGKIAKFFMNDKLSTVAKTITGKTITLVGTVKKQEVNPHTGCQETMFNRVKIEG